MKPVSLTLIFLLAFSPALVFAQEDTRIPSAIEYIDPLFRPTQEALQAFFVGFGEAGPKIVSALILLVIGVAVSFAFKKGIQYALKAVFLIPELQKQTKIDSEKIGKKGTTGWTRLINQIPEMFFWFIFAFFFILGLNALDLEQASDAMTQFWIFFPRLIGALVFLVAGFIAEKIIINSIEGSRSPYYGKDSGIKIPIQVIIYGIVISIAVTMLGIGDDIIPILVWVIGIGLMGAFAVAFGLGGRYFVTDLASLFSLQKLGIKKGAQVEYSVLGMNTSEKVKGEIVDMSTTHIKMKEDDKVFTIPTQSIFGQKVTITKEAPIEDKKGSE